MFKAVRATTLALILVILLVVSQAPLWLAVIVLIGAALLLAI